MFPTLARFAQSRTVLTRLLVAGLILPAIFALVLLPSPGAPLPPHASPAAVALRTALEEATLADRLHETLRGDVYAGLIAWTAGNRSGVVAAHADAQTHLTLMNAALERSAEALTGTPDADIAAPLPALIAANAQAIEKLIGPLADHTAKLSIRPFTQTWQETRTAFASVGGQLESRLETALTALPAPSRSLRWMLGSLAMLGTLIGLVALSRLGRQRDDERAQLHMRLRDGIARVREAGVKPALSPGAQPVAVRTAAEATAATVTGHDRDDEADASADPTVDNIPAETPVSQATDDDALDALLKETSDQSTAEPMLITGTSDAGVDLVIDDDLPASSISKPGVDAASAQPEPIADIAAPAQPAAAALSQGPDKPERATHPELADLRAHLGDAAIATQTASELAHQARVVAASSHEQLSALLEAMRLVSLAPAQTDEALKAVEQAAFRANVLALNTEVEAARLGEPGRSLSLIATEFRALARQTTTACSTVREQLAESTARAAESGDLAQAIARIVDELTDTMAELDRQTLVMNETVGNQEQSLTAMGQSFIALHEAIGEGQAARGRQSQALDTLEKLL